MVQLSHQYMNIARKKKKKKNIAMTIQTFAREVISLLNTLSKFVISFLPRS